jgi:hypothetical protein
MIIIIIIVVDDVFVDIVAAPVEAQVRRFHCYNGDKFSWVYNTDTGIPAAL